MNDGNVGRPQDPQKNHHPSRTKIANYITPILQVRKYTNSRHPHNQAAKHNHIVWTDYQSDRLNSPSDLTAGISRL